MLKTQIALAMLILNALISDRSGVFYSLARKGGWDFIKSATEGSNSLTSGKKFNSPIGWRPLINLIYDFGEVNRLPQHRQLAVLFAHQVRCGVCV